MSSPEGGWQDPVVGGTILRIPGIQSPNFSMAGQSGWAILQSGLAFFFNVVLSGGTITGPDFIFNPQGLFFYSGSPGGPVAPVSGSVSSPGSFSNLAGPVVIPAGTYLVSWSVTLSGILSAGDANNCGIYHNNTFVTGSINPAVAGTYPQAPVSMTIAPGDTIKILNSNAGTAGSVYGASFSATGNLIISLTGPGVTVDPKGNPVTPDGLRVYGTTGNGIFMGLSGAVGVLQFPSGAANEQSPAQIASAINNPGVTAFIATALEGPIISLAGHEDWVGIQLNTPNADGSSAANGSIFYVSSTNVVTQVVTWDNTGFNIRQGAYTPADGNSYTPGLLSLVIRDNVPVATTGTVTLASCLVQAGITYRIKAKIAALQGATASVQQLGIGGTTTQNPTQLFAKYIQEGSAQPYSTVAHQANTVFIASPAYIAARIFWLELDGVVTPAASGALALVASCTVAADPFTVIGGSFADVWQA